MLRRFLACLHHEPLQGLTPVAQEQRGRQEGIEHRCCDEAAEDGDGDRMEDFPARRVGGDHQRKKATPAESAVIRTGVSRSRLPRITSSGPNGMFS